MARKFKYDLGTSRKSWSAMSHGNVNVYVDVLVDLDGFWKTRLRSGLFEGPATAKPPALPMDDYFGRTIGIQGIALTLRFFLTCNKLRIG